MYQLVAISMTYISLSVSEMKQQGSFLRAEGGDVLCAALGSYEVVAPLSLSALAVQFSMMVYIYNVVDGECHGMIFI